VWCRDSLWHTSLHSCSVSSRVGGRGACEHAGAHANLSETCVRCSRPKLNLENYERAKTIKRCSDMMRASLGLLIDQSIRRKCQEHTHTHTHTHTHAHTYIHTHTHTHNANVRWQEEDPRRKDGCRWFLDLRIQSLFRRQSAATAQCSNSIPFVSGR